MMHRSANVFSPSEILVVYLEEVWVTPYTDGHDRAV